MRYTTFPTSEPVSGMSVLQGVWFHVACLLKAAAIPSNESRAFLPVKLSPGTGWCVLFGAVNSAHAARGRRKNNFSHHKFRYQFRSHLHPIPSFTIISHPSLLLDTLYTHSYLYLLICCSCSCYQAFALTETLCHLIRPLLSPFLSPVLSLLLRVVQQDSDNVEEAAQHLEGKVKHSNSQTCNQKDDSHY